MLNNYSFERGFILKKLKFRILVYLKGNLFAIKRKVLRRLSRSKLTGSPAYQISFTFPIDKINKTKMD